MMRFFHDPAQHNENEQKPRFHEKVAKLCILIGKTQRRKHHPDTWLGKNKNRIFYRQLIILDLQPENMKNQHTRTYILS